MRRGLFVIGIVVLAACSSSHKKATPTTSTTGSTSSTTSAPPTSTPPTSGGGPVPTTTPGTTPATSGGGSSNVRLSGPTGPTNPVDCNAETTLIELSWTTSGANTVELRIDNGPVFARYANGTHHEMLALTCDGKPHTYKLTATAGGSTTSSSITLESKT